MNTKKSEYTDIKKNYSKELQHLVLVIFMISLTIVILANSIYYSSGANFNTENFLMLLPFNLLGLSFTLYVVMIILYNLTKNFI
jgi:uncharacterized membrane protein